MRGKAILSTCLDIAHRQHESIARTTIKSTVRQAVAFVTDDLVEWLANWICQKQEGDNWSVIFSWTTQAFMKLTRGAMIDIYLDEKIDEFNARYGFNL